MKPKYKLILEYPPGNLKLGDVIEWDNTLSIKQYRCVEKDLGVSGIDPSKFPIYWQEVIEKDYEILSVKNKYSGNIFLVNEPQYTGRGEDNKEIQPAEVYLVTCDIYSVKRLSDGEVFTVGDKVHEKYKKDNIFEIEHFSVHHNMFVVEVKQKQLHTSLVFSFLQHSKKPLFTTEDGVDIFEGDNLFWLYKENNAIGKWIWNEHRENLNNPKWFWFSTRDAAELYRDSLNSVSLFRTFDGVPLYKGDKFYLVQKDTLDSIYNCSLISKSSLPRNINDWLIFSSEETAEKYILMNKFSLSIEMVSERIFNIVGDEYHDKIIDELITVIKNNDNS